MGMKIGLGNGEEMEGGSGSGSRTELKSEIVEILFSSLTSLSISQI
jgi:hypothetical protein